MVRRYPLLSERHVEVLTWVADGCPDGVWGDFTYKHTTYALPDPDGHVLRHKGPDPITVTW